MAEAGQMQPKAHLCQQQVNPFLIEGVLSVKTHHTLQMFARGEACESDTWPVSRLLVEVCIYSFRYVDIVYE